MIEEAPRNRRLADPPIAVAGGEMDSAQDVHEVTNQSVRLISEMVAAAQSEGRLA